MATVEELAMDDAPEAAAVTEECIREAWRRWMKDYYPEEAIESDLSSHTAGTYARCIENPDSFILVAKEDGRIVGVSTGEVEGDSGVARLKWVGVISDARKHGIGNHMLESVENLVRRKGCHKIYAMILPCLTDAVRLKYRRGWVPECNLIRHSWKVDFMVMGKWFD